MSNNMDYPLAVSTPIPYYGLTQCPIATITLLLIEQYPTLWNLLLHGAHVRGPLILRCGQSIIKQRRRTSAGETGHMGATR
jgi:hypothetical protein